MATKASRRQDLEVHLGSQGQIVGRLYLGSGKRSAFKYDERWLRDPRFFAPSPDLLPVLSVQHPDGAFFRALEDTAPDSWGERVISALGWNALARTAVGGVGQGRASGPRVRGRH